MRLSGLFPIVGVRRRIVAEVMGAVMGGARRRLQREMERRAGKAAAAEFGVAAGDDPEYLGSNEDAEQPGDPWQVEPGRASEGKGRSRRSPAGRADAWTAEIFGTVEDVARLLRLHFKTVEKLRRKHGLPFVRLGGAIRYPFSDVLRWVSARKEGA